MARGSRVTGKRQKNGLRVSGCLTAVTCFRQLVQWVVSSVAQEWRTTGHDEPKGVLNTLNTGHRAAASGTGQVDSGAVIHCDCHHQTSAQLATAHLRPPPRQSQAGPGHRRPLHSALHSAGSWFSSQGCRGGEAGETGAAPLPSSAKGNLGRGEPPALAIVFDLN